MRRGRAMCALAGRAAFALVLFFGLGEVITRAFDVVDRLSPLPRGLFVATDHPDLPYVLRPGADVTQLGVPVRVNALGLRGPDARPTPAPGVRRVLALGDSVTFGHQLPVEQAFPALLERALDAREPGRWEVLNGGVQGYDTAAELAWLERRGLALAPDVVVVGFNLNDYDYAPVLDANGILTGDRSARGARRSLAATSEFYLLLRWLVRTGGRPFGPAPPSQPAGERASPWAPFDRTISGLRKRYYRSPPDERWRRMVAALAGLGRVTAAHGIRLVVAIVPDGDQIDVESPDLEPQRRVLGACERAGVTCLDLVPDFEAASEGEGSLFLDVMHPNAAGNAVVAARLAAHLLGA